MARGPNRAWSLREVEEVINLYCTTDTPTREICRAYDLNHAQLYRQLRKHRIPLRKEHRAMPQPPTPPNGHAGLAVTVDKYGTVLAAVPEGPQLPEFEVTVRVATTTTIVVRAVSLEEAIHRARTDPKVIHVVGAIEKPAEVN
jgi:transposase-like protein